MTAGLVTLIAVVCFSANRPGVKPPPIKPNVENANRIAESPGFDSLLEWNSTQDGLDVAASEINELEGIMENELEETK